MSDTAEAAPDKGFLRRMTLATAWGEGLDGFDLGVISVVIPLIETNLGVSPVWAGLIGASSLIGIFFGAPVAGFLTDKLGRKRLFFIDILAFVALGLLQAVVSEPWQLFVVRLALGFAVGAEYAIGSAMLAEFAPSHGRGRAVAQMLVYWYSGYLVSVLVSYGLVELGLSWRWVLMTSALPALVVLGLRIGLPESPRWLYFHGRQDEARAVIDKYLGGEDYLKKEEYDDDKPSGAGWRQLFAPGMRSRFFFVCTFYVCIVTPYFAIFTFAPQVFKLLNISNTAVGTIFANAIAAIGALVGMLTIEKIGRRQQLIGPLWIMAAALLVIGLWSGAPSSVVIGCFALFAFFNAMSGNLTAVYPIEVFPTEVRATGVGMVNAVSRIGAAAGTFLLPVSVSSIGIGPTMVIAAGLCVVGAVVSQILAPETTGMSLSRCGAPVLRRAPAGPAAA